MDIFKMSKIDFEKKVFAKNAPNFSVGNKLVFYYTRNITKLHDNLPKKVCTIFFIKKKSKKNEKNDIFIFVIYACLFYFFK